MRKKSIQIFFIMFLFFNLVQCGLQQPLESLSDTNVTQGPVSYQSPVGSSYKHLSMNQGMINLDVTGHNDVVLAIYAHDIDGNETYFNLKANTDNQENLVKYSKSNNVQNKSFYETLRQNEEDLPDDEVLPEHYGSYLVKESKLFETREFNVINSFSATEYETIEAILLYENDQFQIFVDVRDEALFSDEQIENMALNFDTLVDKEHEIYGLESDVNNDGKFAVLLTHVVNEIGLTMGGMVTGFFYGLDLFSKKKYPFSNEMEIIYSFVPDPNGQYGTPVSETFAIEHVIPGVLPHELQHMISFNQHYFLRASSPEKGWLNEALSHFTEDFVTMNEDDVVMGYGTENPARVANYLSVVNQICFTCGTSLEQRGGSYLFLKYLYTLAEQGQLSGSYDGYELLQNLTQTSLTGVHNVVNAAFGSDATTDRFKELLSGFALSVYFSDSGFVNVSEYDIMSFKLRGNMEDNRGTYLQGPALLEVSDVNYTGSLPQTGVVFLQISQDVIAQTNGQMLLSVNQDADNVGVYLIQ